MKLVGWKGLKIERKENWNLFDEGLGRVFMRWGNRGNGLF
jgi:hypothetical protein